MHSLLSIVRHLMVTRVLDAYWVNSFCRSWGDGSFLCGYRSVSCKQEDLGSHPQNLHKMPGMVHVDSATQGDRMGSEAVPWFRGVVGLSLELLGEIGAVFSYQCKWPMGMSLRETLVYKAGLP